MIKKHALLILTATFLIVFSEFSYSQPAYLVSHFVSDQWLDNEDVSGFQSWCNSEGAIKSRNNALERPDIYAPGYQANFTTIYVSDTRTRMKCDLYHTVLKTRINEAIEAETDGMVLDDEQCQSVIPETLNRVAPSVANYLAGGGRADSAGGACSFTGAGGVMGCTGSGDTVECSIDVVAESTGKPTDYFNQSTSEGFGDTGGTFSVIDLSGNDYLTELPGGCTDNASCVAIGDKSYLVDWDSAPDYFEYVGSDGTTYSKPSGGGGGGGGSDGGDGSGGDVPGGCFGNCYPDDGEGGDGGDAGGGDSGSGSGSGDGDSGSTGGGGNDGDSSGGDSDGSSGGSGGGSSGGGTGGGSTGSGDGSGGGEGEGDGSGDGEGEEGENWEGDAGLESPWPEDGEGEALIDSAQQRLDDLLATIQGDMSSKFGSISSASGSCNDPEINFKGSRVTLGYCEKIEQWGPMVKPAVLLVASIFAMFSLLRVRD